MKRERMEEELGKLMVQTIARQPQLQGLPHTIDVPSLQEEDITTLDTRVHSLGMYYELLQHLLIKDILQFLEEDFRM